MMTLYTLPWLLLGIFLNAGAQLLLKAGANSISQISFNWANAFPIVLQLASNFYILSGLMIYVISVIVWIGVLSRVNVSIAYPMVSLGYVVNAIAAFYIFHESLSAIKVGGIFIILIGVFMVAY